MNQNVYFLSFQKSLMNSTVLAINSCRCPCDWWFWVGLVCTFWYRVLLCMPVNVSCILQIESIYKKAHETIRADPARVKKQKDTANIVKKRWNRAKLSLSERKNRIAQKKESWKKKLEAGDVDAWTFWCLTNDKIWIFENKQVLNINPNFIHMENSWMLYYC